MSVESATYINGLNAANPGSTDLKAEGDDHIRLIKSTVKATFPNVTGAVTPTHTQLNYVAGVTAAIQGQIDGKIGATTPAFTSYATFPVTTSTVSGITIAGSAADTFTVDTNKSIQNYGLTWKSFSDATGGPSAALSGFGGIRFYAGGIERLQIAQGGGISAAGALAASSFSGALTGSGTCTVNGGRIVTDGGGATFTTSLPVGTMVLGYFTGALVAPGGTKALDGSTYVRVYGTDGSTNSLVQYGTWRMLGFATDAGSLWVRVS